MQEKRTWYLRHLNSRRTMTALVSIGCLFVMAIVNKVDTSMSIATVAVGLAGANAIQKRSLPAPKEGVE